MSRCAGCGLEFSVDPGKLPDTTKLVPKKKAEAKTAHDSAKASVGQTPGPTAANCPACAELGDRFHYSFPEEEGAREPDSFAHLDVVAHSIISFRDELVQCDQCQTYFAWDRMWDNDVYSTPLDYVDIYRLTPKEAEEWLKREKDWARKERAAERRAVRKLEQLWADETTKLSDDERVLFQYIVATHSQGRSGEMIQQECGLEPSLLWQALESLQQKKIVTKSLRTADWPREHANYEVSGWRHSSDRR